MCLPGSFQQLNAEEIENEVTEMWRTMYKLTKSFGDQPGPRNVAERTRGRIDKFKQYMPILQIICNPGIRDRHWDEVCSKREMGKLQCMIAAYVI